MARHRKRKLRYGITSGVLAFGAGLAVITLLLPKQALGEVARWKASIWVYLGTHFVRISDVHFGGMGMNTIQPVDAAGLPVYVYTVPVIASGLAGLYTCYEMNSTRIKHNISNSMAAGMGYFLFGLGAMVLVDARPSVSFALIIAFVVGGGIWVGSNILGFLSGGVPFLGVTSLGGIAALGIIVIMGGIAVVSMIFGLIVISFGAPALSRLGVGASRVLHRRGSRHGSRFTRTQGLKSVVTEYWKFIVATLGIGIALYLGLSR